MKIIFFSFFLLASILSVAFLLPGGANAQMYYPINQFQFPNQFQQMPQQQFPQMNQMQFPQQQFPQQQFPQQQFPQQQFPQMNQMQFPQGQMQFPQQGQMQFPQQQFPQMQQQFIPNSFAPQLSFNQQMQLLADSQRQSNNANYQAYQQSIQQESFLRQLNQERLFWQNYWLRFWSNRLIGIGH